MDPAAGLPPRSLLSQTGVWTMWSSTLHDADARFLHLQTSLVSQHRRTTGSLHHVSAPGCSAIVSCDRLPYGSRDDRHAGTLHSVSYGLGRGRGKSPCEGLSHRVRNPCPEGSLPGVSHGGRGMRSQSPSSNLPHGYGNTNLSSSLHRLSTRTIHGDQTSRPLCAQRSSVDLHSHGEQVRASCRELRSLQTGSRNGMSRHLQFMRDRRMCFR